MRRIQVALSHVPLFDVFHFDGAQYRKYRNGEARPVYREVERKAIRLSRETQVEWVDPTDG